RPRFAGGTRSAASDALRPACFTRGTNGSSDRATRFAPRARKQREGGTARRPECPRGSRRATTPSRHEDFSPRTDEDSPGPARSGVLRRESADEPLRSFDEVSPRGGPLSASPRTRDCPRVQSRIRHARSIFLQNILGLVPTTRYSVSVDFVYR